ncbi:MAG: response regulator [Acidobacteriia bacterium]|nr:response regulator [Terriglobia bacterium]
MPATRILLIDDDPIDRDILRLYLEIGNTLDVECLAAENGKQGLELIREWRPDCVLLDLHLPDMEGLELLSQALKESSCPLIVITAHGSEEIAAEAMRNGAADYLIKGTLSGGTLSHSVARVLERESLRRQVEEQRLELERRNSELEAGLARERAARSAAEESENRYRTLAEAIPQIVWTAEHAGGGFDYVNERWSRATGAPKESAFGDFWLEQVHPDDRSRIARTWSVCRSLAEPFETECRLHQGDGSYRYNLLRAVPVTRDGEMVRWLGTFTDIEEQKRAEQLLGQRQKLESIGLLAGGIAHDFNNLLVGIIGSVSYTLDVLPADHETRAMLDVALHSGERAAHLVRQMLAYAGKSRFLVEKIDLTEVVHRTWDLVRASIPGSIQVQFLTREGLPPIETDASQIEQITMNLILNAAEAIPSGRPGRIIVRTDVERLEEPLHHVTGDLQPGTFLVLEVHDDGCGMDDSTRARIFDPFFTTKFTGRGLGLAAVQGIVRNNNGAVIVESAPGRGATFRILLPPSISGAAADSRTMEEEWVRSVKPGRILVVDDELSVLQVVRNTLEHAGHEVSTAANGRQAIEILRNMPEPFSLILLDMNMPAMSGLEALEKIRELNGDVPVLLCSGFSENEMRARSEGLAVSGFLQKPFTSRTLYNTVALHLENVRGPIRNHAAGRI